jgi:acetoin utilization protein AcuB
MVTIADIMTRTPVTISPETDLLACAKKIVQKRVGSLLIVDNKKLVGFISERDILWAMVKKSKRALSDIKAIDISPKKIVIAKPEWKIKQAIDRMNRSKVDRLPVVQSRELIGIITAKDILSFHPEVYPELGEYAKIREEAQKLKRFKKLKLESSEAEEELEL